MSLIDIAPQSIDTAMLGRKSPQRAGRFSRPDSLFSFFQVFSPAARSREKQISKKWGLLCRIVTGCSHAGVVNIVRQCREMTEGQPVEALIGGFHLVEASEQRIVKTAEELAKLDIQSVFAGHCTGFRAQAELLKRFGDRFQPLSGRCRPHRSRCYRAELRNNI